ncbi:MAG: outer rane autotransporter barrel domain [Firmicutes bacterium]|nr:outer rane autotransporter barrel domain [Bacillota bacterium]
MSKETINFTWVVELRLEGNCMLKNLRKDQRRKRLTAALAATLFLTIPAATASAAITYQLNYFSGGPYTITDSIVTNDETPLIVSNGVYATMNGGSITLNAGIAPLTFGVEALDTGVITLNNVAVHTTGGIGLNYGLHADTGGRISMTGGSITTDGMSSHGAAADGAGSVITLTNTAINAAGAGSFALFANGGTLNVKVNGQNLYGNGGLAGTVGGSINIAAYGSSHLTGMTGGSGTINMELNDNAVWTSPYPSTLNKLILNGGMVVLSRPGPGPNQLLISADLAGTGGTFRTSMNINDDTVSDRVIIHGVASGSHRFEVKVVGGYPTDLYRVVQLVDINDALPNTVTFNGGSDVGPYRYGVAKGTSLSSAYNSLVVGSENDYYLYNTFGPSTPANASIGTSLSSSTMWYGEVNEIRKRLGDLRAGTASGDGLWARTYASKYNVKPGGDQRFEQHVYGIEIGSDSPRKYTGGTRHTGWVAGSGWANRSFEMGGHGDSNSLYVGGYTSWLKDDGTYWDIVAKQNWFRHHFDVPLLGGGRDSAEYNTPGFGLSVETGKRFEKADGTFFEPQAELAALWTRGKRYTTTDSLAVNAQAETSLQLRVGAVFGHKTATATGSTRQTYGKLAWVHELAGESRTTVDGVAFDSSLKGGRLVVGAGLMVDTSKNQLYLDVERAWGNKTEMPWGINLGCRWKL